MRPPIQQQPAGAWDGTPPGLGDDLEQLQTELDWCIPESVKPSVSRGYYVRLSYRKYDVTIKMGSAIIVDTHFRAARLYSGLEGSTFGFDSADGSEGFGTWGA